jgi:hypothetical protein
LRPATNGTKERSPNFLGKLALQRSDFVEIQRHFQDGRRQEVICGIAGWLYTDGEGKHIQLQLSPPYVKQPVTVDMFFEDSDPDDWEDDPSDK